MNIVCKKCGSIYGEVPTSMQRGDPEWVCRDCGHSQPWEFDMAKKKKQFSANDAAQPIYEAMHEAIKDLPRPQAIEVCDEVSSHVEAMAEAIREEEEETDEIKE